MQETEAVELLRQGLNPQIQDAEKMRHLVAFLDNLPLAIQQASAYMAEIGMSVATYLHRCHSSNKALICLVKTSTRKAGIKTHEIQWLLLG